MDKKQIAQRIYDQTAIGEYEWKATQWSSSICVSRYVCKVERVTTISYVPQVDGLVIDRGDDKFSMSSVAGLLMDGQSMEEAIENSMKEKIPSWVEKTLWPDGQGP